MTPAEVFEARARANKLYAGSNYIIASDGTVWECMMWANGGICYIKALHPGDSGHADAYLWAVKDRNTMFEQRGR